MTSVRCRKVSLGRHCRQRRMDPGFRIRGRMSFHSLSVPPFPPIPSFPFSFLPFFPTDSSLVSASLPFFPFQSTARSLCRHCRQGRIDPRFRIRGRKLQVCLFTPFCGSFPFHSFTSFFLFLLLSHLSPSYLCFPPLLLFPTHCTPFRRLSPIELGGWEVS